jgi:hypothetical protein
LYGYKLTLVGLALVRWSFDEGSESKKSKVKTCLLQVGSKKGFAFGFFYWPFAESERYIASHHSICTVTGHDSQLFMQND